MFSCTCIIVCRWCSSAAYTRSGTPLTPLCPRWKLSPRISQVARSPKPQEGRSQHQRMTCGLWYRLPLMGQCWVPTSAAPRAYRCSARSFPSDRGCCCCCSPTMGWHLHHLIELGTLHLRVRGAALCVWWRWRTLMRWRCESRTALGRTPPLRLHIVVACSRVRYPGEAPPRPGMVGAGETGVGAVPRGALACPMPACRGEGALRCPPSCLWRLPHQRQACTRRQGLRAPHDVACLSYRCMTRHFCLVPSLQMELVGQGS
jgi:hypothetical protein